jgi:cytochrome P450
VATALLGKSDCTVEFDHHSKEFASDPVMAYRQAREHCPLAWSEAWGGFWVVTGYDEAFAVLHDDELFSSARERGGVAIPSLEGFKVVAPPIDLDPPRLQAYRKLLTPSLSPGAVSALAAEIEAWANEAIDGIIGTGRGDLLTDLGSPVPARAIMRVLGYDLNEADRYAEVHHLGFALPPGDDEQFAKTVVEFVERIPAECRAAFWQKRESPGDDLVSVVATAEVDPGLISPEELENVGTTLLAGGVDTTTNWFANSVIWLSRHPQERARLAAEPALWRTALEEFLRYFSPVPGLARTITRDAELFGHQLSEGDKVFVSFGAANHDPRRFDRPDDIVLDRDPNRHIAFGLGMHRCVGSHLARLAFRIMLGAVLQRMPDYQVLEDDLRPYEDRGGINGWLNVPVVFTPSERRGGVRSATVSNQS